MKLNTVLNGVVAIRLPLPRIAFQFKPVFDEE